MATKVVLQDKDYFLTDKNPGLAKYIQTRDGKKNRLLFLAEEEVDGQIIQRNKVLRYSRNHQSPFEEDQDGTAIIEPIVFENGHLNVPKINPSLQTFLAHHPGNVKNGGNIFYEHDPIKEANEYLEELEMEADAVVQAKNLTLDKMLAIGRIHLEGNVENMPFEVLKRNIVLWAKSNPLDFFEAINDVDLEVNNVSARAFEEAYVIHKFGKDIHYNLADNKKKILTVPHGVTPVEALTSWFVSDQGQEFYTHLKKLFEKTDLD